MRSELLKQQAGVHQKDGYASADDKHDQADRRIATRKATSVFTSDSVTRERMNTNTDQGHRNQLNESTVQRLSPAKIRIIDEGPNVGMSPCRQTGRSPGKKS
jgi:hypothetical protein